MAERSAETSRRLALFRCDTTLRIEKLEGSIAERLGCAPEDLYHHLWHPFLHKDDWPTIERMGAALVSGQAGRYDLRALARSGDRLALRICTFVSIGPAQLAAGSIHLEHWESPRTIVDLGSTDSLRQ